MSLRPESAAAMTAHRREAVRLAKAQERAVTDKCNRSGQPVPPYAFDELIGKGSFGRVYKGRETTTGRVVAVKVLDIDEADFQAYGDMKDEQIRDFNKEIAILRRAQESGAENLNQIIEALPVHSQLWMVCEHCPGGSVKTLMRATNDRLEEKYLIVVARELAKALKGLHQAGIMHRDVKAANVLIHENGGLQLCDFGIAAAVEGHADKRRTFVGTFHWMPPELWAEKPEYSDEVDVWGYGCTIYECAMGTPPNSDVRERQQLKVRMRRLKQSIALPEKETFSDGLRSLVKYSLNPDPASRPSMQDILSHDFLTQTEDKYPNAILSDLVQQYYKWLFMGGQRISLFMPGGAVAASEVDDDMDEDAIDEWNFSMTQDFERRVSQILEIPDLSEMAHNFEPAEGELTPRATSARSSPPRAMTSTEQANFERRVQRGADLSNLFDQAAPNYEYRAKTDFVPIREPEKRSSDLPLRAMAEDRPVSTASIAIDLGDFDMDDYAIAAAPRTNDERIQTTYAAATPQKEEPAFILPDAATIRAKRADSKGPRDSGVQDMTMRPISSYDSSSDPTTQDWTAKEDKRGPSLQEAAEITPTEYKTVNKARDTMGWSFADAMSAVSTDQEESTPEPTQKKTESPVLTGPELEEKAKKHATMDWSFSMAMAQADSDPTPEFEDNAGERTPSRHNRPSAVRMYTEPVTAHEMSDVYDFSRPSTSMSDAYSESDQSSMDFDPFALDQRSAYGDREDGPGDAELDDVGINDFYATRGRAMIPPDMSGPGPDINNTPTSNGIPATHAPAIPYGNDRGPHTIEDGPGPASNGSSISLNQGMRSPKSEASSPRSLGHIRGNGSGANRRPGSGSSTSSTRTTHNVSNSVSTSVGSGSIGGSSNSMSNSRSISLLMPAPPSLAAMAHDASPETVERELERLLGDFQAALGVISDVISDGARGRARRRKTAESGSEWEDED